MTVANEGARFVLIGGLSGQLAASGTGRASPVTLDSTQIVLKRISLKGYSADDDPDAREEWPARLAAWLKTGDIHIAHTLIEGLDQAPAALEAAAAVSIWAPSSSGFDLDDAGFEIGRDRYAAMAVFHGRLDVAGSVTPADMR